ncbi:MAG: aminoacyl-tRNA hydrolase [Acutalibacter sp.]|jgi:PTH1 family peptidyl-tRNA hydrolase
MLHLFQKNTPSPGPVEFLVVGLGNPGKQYEGTRHNAGFMAVDTIAQKHHTEVKRIKFKGTVGECVLGGKKVLLLKPSTYMNLSGQAVQEAMQFYKLSPEKVLVIYDDINLDPGKLRIRRKGSDGGHNGMKNIIYLAGSDQFPRIKLGVGKKPHPDYNLADWVLSRFTDKERESLATALDNAAAAAELIVRGDIDRAMNLYNS